MEEAGMNNSGRGLQQCEGHWLRRSRQRQEIGEPRAAMAALQELSGASVSL